MCQVFAWDDSKNAVDDDEDDGRSYVSVVSEVLDENTSECDGKAQKNKGEARMDIEDSGMAYLGYQGSESYGLTWKVREREEDIFLVVIVVVVVLFWFLCFFFFVVLSSGNGGEHVADAI